MFHKAPKGVRDIFDEEAMLFTHIEKTARDIFERYGYSEIRLPTFENQEIFLRSVGETTDIVEKQMYTFFDKKNRKLSLKPEATASVVRAILEHSLHKKKSVIKLYYIERMFRYEKPQKVRFREFYQIGAELFGIDSVVADIEIMMLNIDIISSLGFSEFNLFINSAGCSKCKNRYISILKESGIDLEKYCQDCKRRFFKNPLRILDCKSDRDKLDELPKINDILCKDCTQHFEDLQRYLSELEISYEIDPYLIRGIDYYTRTIFEVKSKLLGSQDAISGGGRYDDLVSDFGGPKLCGVGFAIGLDRLVEVLKSARFVFQKHVKKTFIAVVENQKLIHSLKIAKMLRSKGINVEGPYPEKSLKSQLRFADSIGCDFSIIVGDEISENKVVLRDMRYSKQDVVEINELWEKIK